MRRQRIITLFAALAAVLTFALPASGHAQAGGSAALDGTYSLNRSASDDVNRAIETAVGRMNFVTRPFGRRRLRATNQPYQRLVISHNQQQVSIVTDNRAAIRTPANGTPVKWKREDGEMLDVSTEWENGRLEQTFADSEGSRRVNVYSLSSDGRTLTMEVTITSGRLPQPLRYKLVYNRA